MFTLTDYLLVEAEGMDPEQAMRNDTQNNQTDRMDQIGKISQEVQDKNERQNKMVSLVAEIQKIMSMMTMSNQSDVARDANLISFIDIIEALNTTEEVIRDRLSSEGAEVDVLGSQSGETHQVAAHGKEWQGDEDNNYDTLFNSIETEVKDTIRTIYTVTSGDTESGTGTLPQFVRAYTSLIVDRLIDALRELGPAQAKNAIGPIISAAKKSVLDVERRGGSTTSVTLQQLVQKYRRSRNRTIGKKNASSRSKMDRVNLNHSIAQGT